MCGSWLSKTGWKFNLSVKGKNDCYLCRDVEMLQVRWVAAGTEVIHLDLGCWAISGFRQARPVEMLQVHFIESVHQDVLHTSIPAQIRQLLLNISNDINVEMLQVLFATHRSEIVNKGSNSGHFWHFGRSLKRCCRSGLGAGLSHIKWS